MCGQLWSENFFLLWPAVTAETLAKVLRISDLNAQAQQGHLHHPLQGFWNLWKEEESSCHRKGRGSIEWCLQGLLWLLPSWSQRTGLCTSASCHCVLGTPRAPLLTPWGFLCSYWLMEERETFSSVLQPLASFPWSCKQALMCAPVIGPNENHGTFKRMNMEEEITGKRKSGVGGGQEG